MKTKLFAFFGSLVLFLLFPVGFAYVVDGCTPAQGVEAIQIGAPIADTIAKDACKELGSDSTNEVVAIGCDVVDALPDRAASDAGPASRKMADAKPQKRYFFIRRADWARIQSSATPQALSSEGGK